MLTKVINPMRRRLMAAASLALCSAAVGAAAGSQSKRILVEVWKAPTCGCCGDWIAHLEKNGFEVHAFETGNTTMRQSLGIPLQYGSCHTAKVGAYALEGHVPAREIQRMLREKPDAVGLAAPGMPIGAPGMDGPDYGNRKDPFDVLLIKKDGGTRVYQSYR